MIRFLALSTAALSALTAPAFAHAGPGAHGSLFAGLSHPVLGLDHLVAMVAVGLWAATLGGRALWMVPAAFVAAMAGGFALGLAGLALPMAEPVVLASLVVIGLCLAVSVRLPASAGAALVGAFAVFHGHAHAGEVGAAGALPFAIGFIVATAALHGAGVLLGASWGGRAARGFGAAAAMTGIVLAIG